MRLQGFRRGQHASACLGHRNCLGGGGKGKGWMSKQHQALGAQPSMLSRQPLKGMGMYKDGCSHRMLHLSWLWSLQGTNSMWMS